MSDSYVQLPTNRVRKLSQKKLDILNDRRNDVKTRAINKHVERRLKWRRKWRWIRCLKPEFTPETAVREFSWRDWDKCDRYEYERSTPEKLLNMCAVADKAKECTIWVSGKDLRRITRLEYDD
jgi:hypothetical protein